MLSSERLRTRWSYAVAVVVALSAFLSRAQAYQVDDLDVVVDRTVLEIIAEELFLSEAQRQHIEKLHAGYWTSIEQVAQEMATRIDRARVPTSERLSDGPMWKAEAKRVNSEKAAVAAALRASTSLCDEFFAAIDEILAEEQRERVPGTRRLIRRYWVLDSGGAWACFDLCSLVEEAALPGGELEPLFQDTRARPDPEEILFSYELEIDAAIMRQLARVRSPEKYKPGDTRIYPDTDKGQRRLKSLRRGWCERQGITHRAATAIAMSVRDPHEARRWWRRYWQTWEPTLFKELPLDDPLTIIETHAELSDDLRRAIDGIASQYAIDAHDRRKRLYEAAILVLCQDLSLNGTEEHHVNFAKAVASLIALHDKAASDIAALFEEEPGERVAAALAPADWSHAVLMMLSLHSRVEAGLVDPATYRGYAYDHELNRHIVGSLRKNSYGVWKIHWHRD